MNNKKEIFIFFLSLLISTICFGKENSLEIAFGGPLPHGESQGDQAMVNAIEMLFEEVNTGGGIENRKLVLRKFNDQNKVKEGIKNAEKRVKGNSLAVIGHSFSSVSIAAGEIYQKHGIPAISPVSTSLQVTEGNDWYFRTIYNDRLPTNFSAHYIQDVFKENTVTVISDDGSFGKFLGDEFLKNSKNLGLHVAYHHIFQKNQPEFSKNFDRIVKDLSQVPKIGIIFLGTHANEAANLTVRIRNAGINDSPTKSVQGITGPNYFNKAGDSIKPVSIGFYRGGYFVASLTQFQLIPKPESLLDLQERVRKSQIVKMGEFYFFKTNVAYAGVQLKKIKNIDYGKKTFQADFFLWFRSQTQLNPKEIIFQNTVGPLHLKAIRQESIGLSYYQLFRVSSTFQAKQNNPDHLGRLSFEIQFRHDYFPRHQILFIPDSLGMGMKQPELLLKEIQKERVLDQSQNRIIDYINTYESSISASSLGNVLTSSTRIEYSNFHLNFRLAKTGIGYIFGNHWLLFLFYLTVNLIVSFLGVFLLLKFLLFMAKKTKTKFDDQLVKLLTPSAYGISFLLGLKFILKDMNELLSPELNQTLENILSLSFFALIFLGFVYRSGDLCKIYFSRWSKKRETQLDNLVAPYIGKVMKGLAVFIMGMKAGEILFNLSSNSFLGILGLLESRRGYCSKICFRK